MADAHGVSYHEKQWRNHHGVIMAKTAKKGEA